MGRTVLFGGTFDPIHHGHLITAQVAMEHLKADRLLLVPAHVSPHKRAGGSADAVHRVAMIQAAIAGIPRWEIDTIELDRQGVSYTIDTVGALQGRQAGGAGERFALLMGVDQLPMLHTWHRVRDLLGMVDLAILQRPGCAVEAGMTAVAAHLGSATAQRVAEALLPVPMIDISSTEIRQRVRAGQSIRYWVPEAVAAYIEAQSLYRA